MSEFFFTIRAKPNSSSNWVGGSYGDALLVSVTAPAAEGKASDAIIRVLAEALALPKRAIRIKSGPRARTKIIAINLDDPAISQKDAIQARISSLMLDSRRALTTRNGSVPLP
jgi:uncharacterized protein YggU (UPF0235/DUF167 family)